MPQPTLQGGIMTHDAERVRYKTIKVDDVEIFYREAGPKQAPTLLLLHGFPTSSQMFRNLIPALADRYHIVAPDYPGFGYSSMPQHDQFSYTFNHLAQVIERFTTEIGLTKYALYVQDYGAPIGYRLAAAHPQRITAISWCRTATRTTKASTTSSGSQSRSIGGTLPAKRSGTLSAAWSPTRRRDGNT